MKANFNRIGGLGVVAGNTAAIGLFFLVTLFAVVPQVFSKEQIKITLPSGVTDVEIQQALDSLPDSGGEVVLPPEKISIRQPVVLWRDHQTLRGSGSATILRLADDANCPVLILGEPANHPQKTVKHLCVADVFIDGNRRHQQRELWHLAGEGSDIRNNGIMIQNVSDSTVENVTCAACRSGGLVTTLGVKRLTVRGLTAFDNQFDGLACYRTTHSVFTDLYLHDNPGAGISLDLAFDHNVISNAFLAGNDLGIFMRASRDNQFHNVTIHDSRHFGVFMAHAEQVTAGVLRATPESECTQNAFTNLTANNCGSAAFRVNNPTCTDNVIIHPRFADNRKGNLSLAGPDLITVE